MAKYVLYFLFVYENQNIFFYFDFNEELFALSSSQFSIQILKQFLLKLSSQLM